MFKLFWSQVTKEAAKIGVDEPTVPRKRRAPLRYDARNSTGVTTDQPEDHYRMLYFEALDTVTGCISERFDQEGYKVYNRLEQLLLKGKQGISECDYSELRKLYHDDFNNDLLVTQLCTFHCNYKIDGNMNIHDVIKIVENMSEAEKSFFSQVVKLTQLLMVIPATNAISERSFSAMRHIKTYLRSTMMQERLNAVMTMHIHKDLTEAMDLLSIANDFCAKSDYRKNKFPKF